MNTNTGSDTYQTVGDELRYNNLQVHLYDVMQSDCMKKMSISISKQAIKRFCQRWKIAELAIFGSALRDNFTSRSDVDVLVTFQPGVDWSLIDHIRMEEELSEIFARPVDLLTKKAVERSANWIRREAILSSAEIIYAAR